MDTYGQHDGRDGGLQLQLDLGDPHFLLMLLLLCLRLQLPLPLRTGAPLLDCHVQLHHHSSLKAPEHELTVLVLQWVN